jgi:hypothetical protein
MGLSMVPGRSSASLPRVPGCPITLARAVQRLHVPHVDTLHLPKQFVPLQTDRLIQVRGDCSNRGAWGQEVVQVVDLWSAQSATSVYICAATRQRLTVKGFHSRGGFSGLRGRLRGVAYVTNLVSCWTVVELELTSNDAGREHPGGDGSPVAGLAQGSAGSASEHAGRVAFG